MQIDCPWCGRRDEAEFTFGGEADIARPDPDVTDDRWAQYLYFRDNVKGVQAERWRHTYGCGQWFNALRDTTTHRFVGYYRPGDVRPDFTQGAYR